MLGFGLTNDREAASKAIKDHGLTWAQALMPNRSLDPIAIDYLCNRTRVPTTFLIDPDGVILATGLSVADAETWLTMILGPR